MAAGPVLPVEAKEKGGNPMKQLVRLRMRPSRDGNSFAYFIDYKDENGKRMRVSLGHADRQKAKRQQAQKERELRLGIVEPPSMKLSDFVADSLTKTGDQTRESTREGYSCTMRDFIRVVGNKDLQRVSLQDGERYRQACLDGGNRPSTVVKKLKEIKCILQTAVKRRQLDENPLAHIQMPKYSVKEVHIFTEVECDRIVKAAQDFVSQREDGTVVRWDLLILMALCTGMRRGELLNCTWSDIDLAAQTLTVSPKEDTKGTWAWLIKDCDRRTLPLTDEVVQMLSDYQSRQPEKHPYVFVLPARYSHIQDQLRAKGKWRYSDSRQKLIPNFNEVFGKILGRAGIDCGTFHDLRRTAISNWLAKGLSEFEVMKLAGHSNFSTTHRFYLRIRDDMIGRARKASIRPTNSDLARTWHAPLAADDVQKSLGSNTLSMQRL
jgi:integrase